eukprot:194331-Amphidinium_carterae.1
MSGACPTSISKYGRLVCCSSPIAAQVLTVLIRAEGEHFPALFASFLTRFLGAWRNLRLNSGAVASNSEMSPLFPGCCRFCKSLEPPTV